MSDFKEEKRSTGARGIREGSETSLFLQAIYPSRKTC
jgi:hypothetical protein